MQEIYEYLEEYHFHGSFEDGFKGYNGLEHITITHDNDNGCYGIIVLDGRSTTIMDIEVEESQLVFVLREIYHRRFFYRAHC